MLTIPGVKYDKIIQIAMVRGKILILPAEWDLENIALQNIILSTFDCDRTYLKNTTRWFD